MGLYMIAPKSSVPPHKAIFQMRKGSTKRNPQGQLAIERMGGHQVGNFSFELDAFPPSSPHDRHTPQQHRRDRHPPSSPLSHTSIISPSAGAVNANRGGGKTAGLPGRRVRQESPPHPVDRRGPASGLSRSRAAGVWVPWCWSWCGLSQV